MEKKIHKLVRFLEEHEDDDNVGDFWVKILMAHADTLRGQVERMEADWDNLRQEFARIKEFVESSMAASEAALDRADLFVCRHMAQQAAREDVGRKSEDANSSNSTQNSFP